MPDNHTIIAPHSPFQESYLNSDANIIIAGGAMGCVPAETEFLTEFGWKKISDYSSNDLVAAVTLNKNDKNKSVLSFEKPLRYIKEVCSSMKKLESFRFSQTLSDEHRVVYWNDDRESYQVREFSDILERHNNSETKGFSGKFKTTLSGVSGKSGIDLSEWELRLMVACLADGSFPKNTINNYCTIKLSKDRKVDRLKWICSSGEIPLRQLQTIYEDRYSNGKIDNFIVHPKYKLKNYTKLFWNASEEQLRIIIDEVGYWDGRVLQNKNSKTTTYYSKHRDDAEFIQYAGTVCGYTSTIVEDTRDKKGHFIVNMVESKFRSFANKDGKCTIVDVQTTDGYKYCFETSTGFLLLRENGNIFITGNSSKSYIGLMRHLRWAEDKFYRGYCIRKNSTTLMKSGGLFEEALELYRQYDSNVVPKYKDQKIVFPSGATVAFSHYETEKSSELYRGLQLSTGFYDEATDSNEKDIWFLISRLRTKAKMTPSIWLTCNPDPDSWIRSYVDWWLYPQGHEKFGLPDPEKNGRIRWLLRVAGQIYWGDSKEEMIVRYGKPSLPIDDPLQVKPMSVQVLLGTVYDNPVLIKTNPQYLANLEALPENEKRRNLYGDWEAREEGSSYFERDWLEEVPFVDESEVLLTVRAFDFASSLKSDLYPSPDYTTSVRMRKMKNGDYIIDDIRKIRIRVGDWEQFVLDCHKDDPYGTDYVIPQDPGAQAERAAKEFAKGLAQKGLYVRKTKVTNRGKLDRFRPFASMAQNGGIKILKNCGTDFENKIINDNDFFYKELEVFTGQRKRGEHNHDD